MRQEDGIAPTAAPRPKSSNPEVPSWALVREKTPALGEKPNRNSSRGAEAEKDRLGSLDLDWNDHYPAVVCAEDLAAISPPEPLPETRGRRRRYDLHLCRSLLSLALLCAAACRSPATESGHEKSGELDGAWRRVFAETIGPDGTRYPGKTYESLLLISDGYYSMNWAFGSQRSDYYGDRFNPTDDEKLARYQALVVNAGRFDIDGDILTIHPTFALVPEFVGGLGEFRYSLDGDTLELVWYRIVSVDGVQDRNTEAGVRYVSRWERISPMGAR